MRHYCLGGCSAPSVCARRSRPVLGARAGTWCCVYPVSPFPPRVSRAACGRPSRPGVPYPLLLVRHSSGRCVPRARSCCPSGSPRVPFACVCDRAPAASAPRPPWVVWCAHLAQSRHWALVGPFHVVRAPPRVLPRSLAPSKVLGGGGPVLVPPYLAWGCCEGRLVSDAVPPPAARPLGRVAGVPRPVCPVCGRCGRGDPAPAPQRGPCGPALLAVNVAEGRLRGGAFHWCEGRLMSGAPPPPTARPLGGLLGSTTHVLSVRAYGCGGPTLSPWPACPVGAACRGGGGGPSPGGVACRCCQGRLVSGAVPPPAARPLGRATGRSATRGFRLRSVRAWGPSTGSTACALAGRRCSLWGLRKCIPAGGAFHRCKGRLRSGASPPQTARPLSGLLGSATHVLRARACGCGGPTLSP